MDDTTKPATPSALPSDAVLDERKAKKKNKVRSAWISFFGRILAQMIGATATVVLGLVVVRSYVGPAAPPAPPSAPVESRQDARPRYARDLTTSTPAGRPLTLAVLPFDNFSGDARHEPFANAMTEALVARLAKDNHLRVISRTSVMRYKGARASLPDIARELQADVVIEASVATSGKRVRVTAQLIDAASDVHLWARSYDRTFGDVLALQAEVSDAIARDIEARLSRE